MLFKNVNSDGLNIFYREAGNETAPKLVLLHGFPASSHQYRNLIPALADRGRRTLRIPQPIVRWAISLQASGLRARPRACALNR